MIFRLILCRKNHIKYIAENRDFIAIAIIYYSYDRESKCNEGYIEQFGVEGNSWFIPKYEERLLHNFNIGNTYYHKDFGVINYNNGIWINNSN